jgi:hypothetical protein
MKPTRNDITGDFIISSASSDAYRDGWERIFGKKKPAEEIKQPESPTKEVPSKQPVKRKPKKEK